MPVIGAVADDLTGATTVGVLLSRSGIKTAAIFSDSNLNDNSDLAKYDGLIVSSDSRSLPKDQAYAEVAKATKSLQTLGITQFSKRTDTTLRGGIGVEIDAMLDVLGDEYVAVMVPSMPKSRRIMVGGFSLIEGVPLIRTQVFNDVKTPVRENYIPRLISEQSQQQVGLVTIDSVMAGVEELKQALNVARAKGDRIILVDAVSEDDVEVIADALVELQWKVLSVDPGALTEKLALRHCDTHQTDDSNADLQVTTRHRSQENKMVIIAAGSATEVTKKQMEVLCADKRNQRVHLNAIDLILNTDEAIRDALDDIMAVIKKHPKAKSIIIETALKGRRLDLNKTDHKYNLALGECSKRINVALGEIVGQLIQRVGKEKVAGLYMTGGDTMVNVCERLHVHCIELIDYVIPQTDIGRFIDGEYKDMPFICKGGMTGNDHIVTEIVERLFNESLRGKTHEKESSRGKLENAC
ncbi:four-carbon acid sugar kinase family protein [Vibrio nitrifigilis]|uniref:Four-carbon acid sugar kinase family protein n=1 Tax=Vibrio nitrifigilis TaxID=2789781 RepID=A0ABS0GIS5_9VIBR|nr:four-carbon acid sugar kinase family protein [Vibrio nitrifigilis]MBF9002339.1 four-carbon acid sugar kinase family protein [Vibrio nitrifigilis]